MENDKRDIAIKLIKLKEEITIVKETGEADRREMKRGFDRKIREVKAIAIGNRKDIEKLWRRSDDNTEKIEKIQDALHTVFKIMITTIIGMIITASIGYVFGLFK